MAGELHAPESFSNLNIGRIERIGMYTFFSETVMILKQYWLHFHGMIPPEFLNLNLKELTDITGRSPALWTTAVFILGCSIGSFLNVCIWRMPRGESLFYPPSHCPKCGHHIRFYENIPLLSYLCLRGKCSQCKLGISPRYFLVELLTGLLFGLIFLRLMVQEAAPSLLPFYCILTAILVTIAFTDCDSHLIPDELTGLALLCGLIYAFLFPAFWGQTEHLAGFRLSFFTGVFTALIFSGVALLGRLIFRRDAFGWGDVKYLTAIAVCVGGRGVFFVLLAGCVFALLGVAFRTWILRRRRRAIAFGPFLSVAFYLWLLFSREIIHWYQMQLTKLAGL